MTVRELIRILKAHPGGLRVVVDGYEDGYDDVSAERIRSGKIRLNTGTRDWEGQHEEAWDQAKTGSEGAKVVEALILQRLSH